MSRSSARFIRVLHVDDEPAFADMAAEFLERQDERFVIETATSASEGMDRLDEGEFDCIVSDYDMSRRDGLEFLATVRADCPDIPFILFTGKGSEEVASEAISAGVTDYMQKETGTDQYTVLANRIKNSVEQFRAEREADRTRRRLRELTESTTDCMWMFTSDWDDLLFLSGYEETWGRSADALEDDPRDFLDAVSPADQERVERAMTRLSNGEPIDIEYRVLRSDERTAWVWVKGEPVVDDDGNVVRVVGFTRDVTDRKEHEQELERTTERMEFALRSTNAGIWELDAETNTITGYPSLCPIFGQSFDTVDEFFEKIHPDDRKKVKTAVQTAIETGDAASIEFRPVSEVEAEWIESQTKPVEDDDGSVSVLIGLLRDITERKRRERAVHETNRQLESVLEASSTAIFLKDEHGRYCQLNEPGCEVLGLDEATDIVGRTDHELFPAEVAEKFRADDERILNSGEPIVTEETVPTVDGTRIYRTRKHPVVDDAGEPVGVCGVSTDITEHKEYERRLNRLHDATSDLIQADTHETIAETTVDTVHDILDTPISAVWFHDETDDRLEPVALSDEGAELLGEAPVFEPDENLAWEVFQSQEPRVFEDVASQPGRHNPETPIRSEIILPLGDHGVLIIGSPAVEEFDEMDISLARILATNAEAALTRADGHQDLVRQHERLDEFASVVSHDLRNPLNVANGQLELARMDCDSEYLDEIADAHERMQTLIDDLLTLARQGESVTETEPVVLENVADTCWDTVATGTATLVTDTEGTIQADRSRLRQLFENLFRNAVDHGGEGVTVTVGEVDGGFYVADDGPGIPQSDRDDVFERGYSTTAASTGFGLAIVESIVEAHGWTVSVTDSADGGARFEITGVNGTRKRATQTPQCDASSVESPED